MFTTICTWLIAFCKRLLRRPSFLILLFLFPLLSISIFFYGNSTKPLLSVALFQEEDSTLARETIHTLVNQNENSVIHFYQSDSLEQFYQDIQNRNAECGYLFTKSYNLEHITSNKELRNSVEVVQSPSSILSDSINELVFASFFRIYNRELLLTTIKQPNLLKNKEEIPDALQDTAAYFQQHCQDHSTFSFATSNAPDLSAQQELLHEAQEAKTNFLNHLCRGILSVLLLLAALCGGVQLFKDRNSGLLIALPTIRRPLIEFMEILAPSILMGISGLVGFLFLSNRRPIYLEMLMLLCYILGVTLFSWLLVHITRSETLFRSLIPILTIGALIFPPIWIDLSTYAAYLTIPKYLFINTYYLEFFL